MARTVKSSGGGVLLALLLLGGAFVLGSCCIGAGVFGWLAFVPQRLAKAPAAPPREVVEAVQVPQPIEKPAVPEEKLDAKKADKEKKPPPPPPPPQPLPPVVVAFDAKGSFEQQAKLDPNAADPRGAHRCVRRFTFDTRADVAYVVAVTGRPFDLRVEPADGGPAIEPRPNLPREVALLADQPRKWVALVIGSRIDAMQPFTLRIRAWDETEPLPAHLKFPATQPVPKIEVAHQIKDKLLVGAAFAPDGKSFWTSNQDMTLTLWHTPFVKKGSYKLPRRFYALAVDGKGRLYVQPGPADKGVPALAKRAIGDIEVYDNLDPKGDADELPPATRTILVRGLVGRLIVSRDGRWVYFLDVHNRKVGRIDTEAGAVDRVLDELAPGTRAFCLSPNGKRIYTCADTGRVEVIDAGTFKLERSVALSKGRPFEIAASDKGIVFLLGQGLVSPQPEQPNCALVDLGRDDDDKVNPMPVPCGHHGQYLQMAPDQSAVFISGDRRISACAVPARPALFQMTCRDYPVRDFFTPFWIALSPDGRTILHDGGVVLAVR